MAICKKLPTTEKQVVDQLKKQKIKGLKSTAIFLTGVASQGRWNEQIANKAYLMKMRPVFIKILDGLK